MRNKIKSIIATSMLFGMLVGIAPVMAQDSTSTTQTTEQKAREAREAKLRVRKAKAQGVTRVAETQIARAQNALNKIETLIKRIEAMEAKLEGSDADLAKLETAITAALTQKETLEKDLATAKEKSKALIDAINNASTDTALQAPRQAVREFQASMRVVKTDLTKLKTSLRQIVVQMEKLDREHEESHDEEDHSEEGEE